MAAPGARPPGLSLVHLFRKSFTVKMAMIASLRKGRRREVCVVKWVSLRENDFLSLQALTFLFFFFPLAGVWRRHCNSLARMGEAQIASNDCNYRNETWSHTANEELHRTDYKSASCETTT